MAVVQNVATSAGAIGVGAGSTLLIRRQFDQTGETTVLRPSVAWASVTGLGALAASHLMSGRGGMGMNSPMLTEFLEDYGESALTAGVVSAFSPKGGGVRAPTV